METKFNVGSWDISSKEFKERNTLGKILLADLKMAQLGQFINNLKRQYVHEECEFSVDEKVYYKHYTNRFKCGVIKAIGYDIHERVFVYTIKPLNAGFVPTKDTRSYVHIKRIDKKDIDIKKATV